MKKLFLTIFFSVLFCGQVFAGNIMGDGATPAEVTAQTKGDVWLSPSSVPYITATPGNIGGTTASNATFQDTITLKDANDTSIIKHVLEPGLGGRLTVGLDETARTMVICDAGDVDTDFGLGSGAAPALVFMDADLSHHSYIYNTNGLNLWAFGANAGIQLIHQRGLTSQMAHDASTGDVNTFNSEADDELTDTGGEQSWMYIEPKINQTATAAYNGLKIKVTETALGDASTGDGGGTNNLILAGTSTDPDKFKVENDGDLTMSVGKLSAAAMTFTFTTEADITDPLTGSVVLLDGDNDGENDTIDLQNGTTTGQVLYLIAAVDIDVNDTCTISYGDTTCTNCPATVFDKVGENAHLVWTGSTWAVVSLQDGL